MEPFSLLKYWRGSTASASATKMPADEVITLPESSTSAPETDDDETDDEGPFFDLEFAVPDDHSTEGGGGGGDEENDHLDEGEDEKDFNFCMASSEGSERRTMSHSDDFFFKGRLVPLETSSIVIAGAEGDPKTQLAVSLLKSATKFRVFILGLRKPKSTAVEPNATGASPKQSQQPSKFFFIKFKVEEVPIVSLFTRDGSSRNPAGSGKAMAKITDIDTGEEAAVAPAASEEKKSSNSKEVVQKYLSKIKPLYIRVSKRYADKLKFSGPLVNGGLPATELSSGEEKEVEAEAEAEAEAEEPVEVKMAEKNLKLAMPAKLRVVYERLGKSRSATSAVAAMSSQPQRRDDSLLQQQDGIQSAIAHCKRSFTATSKDTVSPLPRSKSDPGADCV